MIQLHSLEVMNSCTTLNVENAANVVKLAKILFESVKLYYPDDDYYILVTPFLQLTTFFINDHATDLELMKYCLKIIYKFDLCKETQSKEQLQKIFNLLMYFISSNDRDTSFYCDQLIRRSWCYKWLVCAAESRPKNCRVLYTHESQKYILVEVLSQALLNTNSVSVASTWSSLLQLVEKQELKLLNM